MVNVNEYNHSSWSESSVWLEKDYKHNTDWLGDGLTSEHIINILKNKI
jgi:hypothetical protein